MRKLPIEEYHRQFGKGPVEIADCSVAAYYSSVTEEFTKAQSQPVLVDRSFAGVVRITGKDAGDLLHRLTTNEMRNLQPGQGVVNIFTNAKGRIVDAVEMLRRRGDYLLLTSPGRAATLATWIEKYTFIEDLRGEDVTSAYALFSIFGEIPRNFAGLPLDDLKAHHFLETSLNGVEIILQQTGGIAPEGYNIVVDSRNAMGVWNFLRAYAEPIGFSTFEAMRVHAGIPAADNEINEEQNPHELDLLPYINFEKGCYIGQEVVARLDTYDKVQRQLAGLEFDGAQVPPLKITLWADGEEAGKITSAIFSPLRNKAIALALLRKKFAQNFVRLTARHDDVSLPCSVVALPFV
jgi:folate-binding protein YgfZ